MIKTQFKEVGSLKHYELRSIAHKLAKEMLQELIDISKQEINIIYKNEKPEFNIKNWYLSFSYCKGLISVVISDNPVGIDCEIDRIFTNKLIEYVFNSNDFNQLSNTQLSYLDIWCMKEAFSKLINANIYKSINYKNIYIEYLDNYYTNYKNHKICFTNINYKSWTIWIAN